MKFFRRGENVEKLSEEEKKIRTGEEEKDKAVKEFLSGFLGEYFRENPARSGERREGNMKAPENRDEILLEILKELRELNSNVKAITVRVDADREEQREFRMRVIELLEEQVRKPF